jgi:hypothetical protein
MKTARALVALASLASLGACTSTAPARQDAGYTPRLDAQGEVVGYEETSAQGGTVLRDVNGRRVGVRYNDLRSRGTNPQGQGVTVIVAPE